MTKRLPKPPKPRAFIAYTGNLFPEHAMGDFQHIAKRYTDVVLPFTQENAMYDVAAFHDIIQLGRALGLTMWISPWGGRQFGGEGLDSGMQVGTWLNAALATNPDGVHFDEPKISTWILKALVAACADYQTMISYPPNTLLTMLDALPSVDLLATEAYMPYPDLGLNAAYTLKRLTDTPLVVWTQAFRIPRGSEYRPGAVLTAVARSGAIPGVWTWMGGRGRGVLMSEEPEFVQMSVDMALEAAYSK